MSASSNSPLVKKLVNFGLGDKEARVYLAALELEVAGANEIAKKAGVNRSSTYVVLESLKKKGLVGVSEDKGVRQYVAASPETLLYSAESAAKKQQQVKEEMESVVPELKALHKDTKQRPKVMVLEGRDGVLAALEDSLKCKEKFMRVCSSHENWLRSNYDFRKYFEEYIKKRGKLGIKMYGIHPDNEITRALNKITPRFDRPILILKEKYKFPADMAIYDNKIGYISPDRRGLAISIESKELSEVMKTLFDLAYKEAKRISKNTKKRKKA